MATGRAACLPVADIHNDNAQNKDLIDKYAGTFARKLFDVLDETFVQHHGILLDCGTSLFETLDTISVQEASRPVSA